MLIMKVVLLIWYSNKNFGFRKIESYLASKIDFEIWKCPIFASSASNCLTRYEQILSGCSLGCKNALNFTCLPMKFHNRSHTNIQAKRKALKQEGGMELLQKWYMVKQIWFLQLLLNVVGGMKLWITYGQYRNIVLDL